MAPRLCAGPSGVSHLGAEPGCPSCCGVLRSSSDMTRWGVWNYRARRKAQVSLRSRCADGHDAVPGAHLAHAPKLLARFLGCCSSRGPRCASARGARSQCATRRRARCAAASAACCWAAGPLSSPRTARGRCTCAAPRNLGSRLFVPLCGTCTGANACTRCHTDPSNRLMYSVPSRSR